MTPSVTFAQVVKVLESMGFRPPVFPIGIHDLRKRYKQYLTMLTWAVMQKHDFESPEELTAVHRSSLNAASVAFCDYNSRTYLYEENKLKMTANQQMACMTKIRSAAQNAHRLMVNLGLSPKDMGNVKSDDWMPSPTGVT